jgi:hypothetical protein
MFSTCNSACVGEVLLTKTDQCDVYQRSEVPVRLLLSLCDFDFPTGDYDDNVLATAIEDAITAGRISVTPELSEVAWADPTTAQKNYRARCRPASTINVSRQLTGKDFNATDKVSAGTTSPYQDRLFFQNLVKNPAVAIRGYVTCDGKIYLFLNPNGTFASYTAHFFTGFDTEIDGQNVEFKNYVLTFNGDPVNWTTPYLDIIEATAESQLGWLFS